jgi:hypothetical protein
LFDCLRAASLKREKNADSYRCPPNSLGLVAARVKELSFLPLSGDHYDFGDLAGDSSCGTCQHRGPGEFGRTRPSGQPKEIEGMGCGRCFAALLGRMMVAKLSEDDRAHGGAFGGRSELPVEAEALTADGTVNVLSEFGSSE